LFRHHDKKLGRELVLTEGAGYTMKHGMTTEKIKSALRSISHYGENSDKALKGQMVTLSQNNVFLAFRDNVVYNAFVPADKNGKVDAKGYFNRSSIGGIRKWAEQLRRYFTIIR